MDTRYSLPKPQLAGVNFASASFTPQVYTPNKFDASLLARSIDKMEEREEKVANQKLNMAKAFSEARSLLPDNEETNKYITDNQTRIENTVNNMIDLGDYSGALTAAKNLASDFVSSPEYVARTKEHQQRKLWLDDLDKSGVDQYIKDYYKHKYSDKNYFTRDDKGNITGTAGWEAPLPEQSQSANAIIQMAVKSTADERTDVGSGWTSSTGTGGSSAKSREWLTADRISETAKSIVNNDPRIKQAFVDQFNAGIYQINKLTKMLQTVEEPERRAEIENQIKGYKDSYYKNGAPIANADTYINSLFDSNNSSIKNAAYDYKHSKTTSDNYAKGTGNGLSISPNPEGIGGPDLSAPGENTVMTSSSESMPSKGNRNVVPYVAPGNNWSSKKDNK